MLFFCGVFQCILIPFLFTQQLNTLSEGLEKKSSREPKLSSTLYELTVTTDRENFAKEHDIFLFEGKVRVYIFLNPDSTVSEREKLIEAYKIVAEKRSNDLLRVLVPVNELISLSKESIVWSIGLPDRPTKP